MADWHELLRQMRAGSIPALSRIISLVENRAPGWRDAMKQLRSGPGNGVTIGITGHPGSGKSSLTGQLARELVSRGNRVGIVAVDPSSHLSGGAFLGDRIRMNEFSALKDVYIRSMGTRGSIGGIHRAAREVIKILDAFGKNYILIETVGVGQDEIGIARAAQVVLLICAPGQGDGIQYLKAGVLEMADIYVANKSDLPGAEQVANHLQGLFLQGEPKSKIERPVVKTSALMGLGIPTLVDEIEKLAANRHLWKARRRRLAMEEVAFLLKEKFAKLSEMDEDSKAELEGAADDLLAGDMDPYSLADRIFVSILEKRLQHFHRNV